VSVRWCPFGVEKGKAWWEIPTVSATAIREKGQVTIPADVREAAGLQTDDQVEWVFQDGVIIVRKLEAKGKPARFKTKAEFESALDSSPLKFKRSWEEMHKDTREP